MLATTANAANSDKRDVRITLLRPNWLNRLSQVSKRLADLRDYVYSYLREIVGLLSMSGPHSVTKKLSVMLTVLTGLGVAPVQ